MKKSRKLIIVSFVERSLLLSQLTAGYMESAGRGEDVECKVVLSSKK